MFDFLCGSLYGKHGNKNREERGVTSVLFSGVAGFLKNVNVVQRGFVSVLWCFVACSRTLYCLVSCIDYFVLVFFLGFAFSETDLTKVRKAGKKMGGFFFVRVLPTPPYFTPLFRTCFFSSLYTKSQPTHTCTHFPLSPFPA